MSDEIIEALNDVLKKTKDDFEKEENKALREELLQDVKDIFYKEYSRIIPNIYKNLSNEEIENKIEFCLDTQMKVANQKSNRELYQYIKMYHKFMIPNIKRS